MATIVDAHVHYWEPSTMERPWNPNGADLGPPWSVERLLEAAHAAGVDKIVQVTPSIMGEDNRYSLEGAQHYPDRVAGVFGRFDPLAPDLEERLARYAQDPRMLGVRLTLIRPEQRACLSDGTLDPLLNACAPRGIMIAILAPGHAPALGELARKHPDAVVIADHMLLHHADPEPFAHWDAVLALADVPNVWMKVDYFPEVAHEPFPFQSVDRYAREIYEGFGPDRMIWGSNFPPSQRAATYGESVRYYRELPFIPEADKAKIMGGTFLALAQRARGAAAR